MERVTEFLNISQKVVAGIWISSREDLDQGDDGAEN